MLIAAASVGATYALAVAAGERSLAQRIFRDGAVYAVAGVLSQGISFLLFPFFAHVFDPRDYGVVDLIGVLMTLVNLTVALEVAQGLGRFFADARTVEDRRAYASTALTFSVLCFTAFAAVTLATAVPLSRLLLGSEVDPDVLRIGIGVFWINGLTYLVTDLLRWQLRPKAYAVVVVLTVSVVAASSGVYVLALDLGVEGALLGQLTGFAFGGLLAVVLSRRLLRLQLDRARLREMLAYSLPLVPASAGVFLNGYADRLAIQTQLTLADVGMYGVAYRLSVVVSLTLIGFQGALMPQLLRHHDDPGTPEQLARVFRLFCALALSVLLLVSTFADELLAVLTPPVYYDAEEVVPFLVAAAFLAGMYMFAPGMHIARRTRSVATVTVTAGLANLLLALLLTPPLGILGAALSFLVSQGAAFTALMVLSQRLYPVPHPWGRLAVGAALGCALTVLGWSLPSVEAQAWAAALKVVVAAAGVGLLARWLMDADERALGRSWLSARRPAGTRA